MSRQKDASLCDLESDFVVRKVCPSCGHAQGTPVLEFDRHNRELGKYYRCGEVEPPCNYVLLQCPKCDLYWQQNCSCARIEASAEPPPSAPPISFGKQLFIMRFLVTLRALALHRGLKPPLRLLDFGGGYGDAALLAKALGFDVTVCELSPPRLRVLSERGLRACESLTSLAGQEFDVLYSNQVMEHVLAPYDTIRELSGLLAPGGYAFFSLPDVTRLKGEFTVHEACRCSAIAAFSHINSFSASSFLRLSNSVGLIRSQNYRSRLCEYQAYFKRWLYYLGKTAEYGLSFYLFLEKQC